MKKKTILLISFTAILVVAGSFAINSGIFMKSTPIVQGHASWVNNYPDPNALIQNADVIIQGQADSLNSYFRDGNTAVTEVNFNVDKWYKGSDTKSRKQITVIQDGGEINGVIYKLDLVEIMQPGNTYLLFLKYDPNTDHYYVLTGWQGFYKLGVVNAENPDKNRTIAKDKLIKTILEKTSNK